jgi:hypothetical protein
MGTTGREKRKDHLAVILLLSAPTGIRITSPNGDPGREKRKDHLAVILLLSAPTGIRTPVVALKGPRPSPLDDGGGSFFILHC